MIKINVNNLTEKQYNNLYLRLCNQYDIVNQDNVTMSFISGNLYGYLLVK